MLTKHNYRNFWVLRLCLAKTKYPRNISGCSTYCILPQTKCENIRGQRRKSDWQKENELELAYTSWFILKVNVLPYNSIQMVFKQQRSYTVKFPGVIHYYCIFSNDLTKLALAQSRNFWKSWSEMCNLKKLESEQNVSQSHVYQHFNSIRS